MIVVITKNRYTFAPVSSIWIMLRIQIIPLFVSEKLRTSFPKLVVILEAPRALGTAILTFNFSFLQEMLDL